MSADMLPVEIWTRICEQFCLHCGNKDMPDFGDPMYEQGKSALTALSLTSRGMRDISQPVLFHCFYDDQDKRTSKTSKFLWTLISQPQLASCVKVLALPQQYRMRELVYHTRSEIEAWNEIGKSMNIPSPKWITRILAEEPVKVIFEPRLARGTVPTVPSAQSREEEIVAFDGEGLDSRIQFHCLHDYVFKDLQLWQQYLLVGLCSTGLTHLAVKKMYAPLPLRARGRIISDCFGPSQHPEPFDFPKLRQFSCLMASFSQDIASFFSRAPSLNKVAFCRVDWPLPAAGGQNPRTPLSNVRSLSLTCSPLHYGDILKLCDQVQELEFHLDDPPQDFSSTVPNPIPDPWPASVKQNLRRLCWSMSWLDSWLLIGDKGRKLFPPLTEFPNLEILEIDRRGLQIIMMRTLDLDPDAPDTAEEVSRRLPEFLPPSIRILHFSYGMEFPQSRPTPAIELEALAAAKKSLLPLLSVVHFDDSLLHIFESKGSLSQSMESLGVVSIMENAGIQLKFGLDPRRKGKAARGMCSPIPGNLQEPDTGISGIFSPAENYFLQN